MKINFKEAREASNSIRENKDCAVVAVSVVGRMSYFDAHALLKSFGRRNRKGTRFHSQTKPALESAGYEVTPVKRNRQPNGSCYTPKTIGDKLKKGYFLCRCKGHIFAVVNGKVEDWTDGRKHRITEIWQVKKKRK